MRYLIGAHAVIFDEFNRLLVLKRTENDTHAPFVWDLPGGTAEFGETLENALQREMQEELQITAEVLQPVYTHTTVDKEAQLHVVQVLFLCNIPGDAVIRLNRSEHEEYRWVPPTELTAFPKIEFLDGFLKNGLKNAKALRNS